MDFSNLFESEGLSPDIQRLIHCPFCGANYDERDIKTVAQFNKSYVSRLICRDCGNAIMASFSQMDGKAFDGPQSKIKMDTKIGEMMQFVEMGPISDNDIMDFVKELKDFDGDFKKITRINIMFM